MGVSARAAGKELGISHVALLKAAKEGRIPREPDGSFDVEKCKAAMERNTNPLQSARARTQQRKPPAKSAHKHRNETVTETSEYQPGDESYSEAVRQNEWQKLLDRKIEYAKKAGELVSLAEFNAFYDELIVRARDIFLQIGPQLCDDLAAETDPRGCEELVTREVRRALGELRRGIEEAIAA